MRWKGGECARRIRCGTAATILHRLQCFAFDPGQHGDISLELGSRTVTG
jgi:hypothetical protein